jgi:hypothetical protein
MYLLSEMHIRVYNARHIKREAAVILADDAGVSHADADGKRVRRVRRTRNSGYFPVDYELSYTEKCFK